MGYYDTVPAHKGMIKHDIVTLTLLVFNRSFQRLKDVSTVIHPLIALWYYSASSQLAKGNLWPLIF